MRRPDPSVMRARVEAQRRVLEARLAKLRARRRAPEKKEKKKRRWWWLLLLLLLLLLRNCSCRDDPPPAPAEPPAPAPPAPVEEPEPPVKPATGRIQRRDRPGWTVPRPRTLSWVEAFRLQVAARGPRLSECFRGKPNPGRMKWTSSVEPVEGTVSQHVLEPILMSEPLSQRERHCVLGVLTEPTYSLETGDEPATPSRISVVIEF